MRISDWSSDVCSSDLLGSLAVARTAATTPTPPITESHTSMNPDDYCQRKAAQSGSSFYYSFLFLPPERRKAITALYAFCREVDDVVDESQEPSVARMKLAWWRSQIEQIGRASCRERVCQYV